MLLKKRFLIRQEDVPIDWRNQARFLTPGSAIEEKVEIEKREISLKKLTYHQLYTCSLPFFTLKSLNLSRFSILQCTIGSFCTFFTIFYQFFILLHLFIFTTKFENGKKMVSIETQARNSTESTPIFPINSDVKPFQDCRGGNDRRLRAGYRLRRPDR